jgi:subfamily B ATP-binding cassette protein MsbA
VNAGYKTSTLIRRVLQFVRPFFGLIILMMIANLVFSAVNALILATVEPVFRTLFNTGSATNAPAAVTAIPSMGSSLKEQFDAFIYAVVVSPDYSTSIRNLSLVIIALFMMRGVSKYASSVMSTKLEEGIIKSVRDKLFTKLTDLSMDFYGRNKTGGIISVLTNDVQVLNHSTVHSLLDLWREGTTILIYISFLMMISVKLTIISVGVSVFGLLAIRLSKSFLRKYGARMQAAQAEFTATLQETVSGIRVVKSLAVEERMVDRFTGQTAWYVRSAMKNTRVLSLVPFVNDIFGISALIMVFYAGGSALGAGEITASNLVTFLFILFGLMQPISSVVQVIGVMQRGLVATSNVLRILDEQPTIVSSADGTPVFSSDMSVQHVTFRYGDADVVHDVSFTIPRGKTIALVGASGSGKSTMLDLLVRFYDPQHGSVTMDGVPITTFDLTTYRRMFGIVSQETILFNDTIANNIALGDPKPDLERVERSARIAHAHEFIVHMPDGYDTQIGDRGMRLSGGQRQRIAIARALYREPEVLLFDEATSALDTESERAVQSAINDVLHDRTAVIVAHRLSTIEHADEIIVFDKGRIVERGRHSELLAHGGAYARLHAITSTAPSANVE